MKLYLKNTLKYGLSERIANHCHPSADPGWFDIQIQIYLICELQTTVSYRLKYWIVMAFSVAAFSNFPANLKLKIEYGIDQPIDTHLFCKTSQFIELFFSYSYIVSIVNFPFSSICAVMQRKRHTKDVIIIIRKTTWKNTWNENHYDWKTITCQTRHFLFVFNNMTNARIQTKIQQLLLFLNDVNTWKYTFHHPI